MKGLQVNLDVIYISIQFCGYKLENNKTTYNNST